MSYSSFTVNPANESNLNNKFKVTIGQMVTDLIENSPFVKEYTPLPFSVSGGTVDDGTDSYTIPSKDDGKQFCIEVVNDNQEHLAYIQFYYLIDTDGNMTGGTMINAIHSSGENEFSLNDQVVPSESEANYTLAYNETFITTRFPNDGSASVSLFLVNDGTIHIMFGIEAMITNMTLGVNSTDFTQDEMFFGFYSFSPPFASASSQEFVLFQSYLATQDASLDGYSGSNFYQPSKKIENLFQAPLISNVHSPETILTDGDGNEFYRLKLGRSDYDYVLKL